MSSLGQKQKLQSFKSLYKIKGLHSLASVFCAHVHRIKVCQLYLESQLASKSGHSTDV